MNRLEQSWSWSWRRKSYAACILASWACLVDSSVLFHHRLNHNSVILGNYLYIDGGETATWNGSGNSYQDSLGVQAPDACAHHNWTCTGNITFLPENNTYSIDLSSSWTNQTVQPNSIQKTAPVLKGESLWLDVSDKTFYAYNGGVSGTLPAPTPPVSNEFWQFIPVGSGGSWSQVDLSQQSQNFTSLVRTNGGASASGNGLGFVLGGIQNSATTPALSGDVYVPVPGLVVYNISSQIWQNVSTPAPPGDTTAIDGAALFVTSYGPEGLLFVLGGDISGPGYGATTSPLNFDTISIYEPLTEQWKLQSVTGTIPHSCKQPCIAGAQGDNGTYEIFLYGGAVDNNLDATLSLDAVYVLSLPAFHWQKTTYQSQYARWGHTCNVVNRQMIVTGGDVHSAAEFATNDNAFLLYSIADPWPQGLGVFDLTDMVWRTSYNSSAGPYITSDLVKGYYASNSRYAPALLTDPTLQQWFNVPANAIQTNSTNETSNPHSGSHKTNAGGIAGGTVGGLAVLSAVLFFTLCLLRRRRQQQKAKSHLLTHSISKYDKAELGADSPYHHQLDGRPAPPRKEAEHSRAELRGEAHHPSHEAGGAALYEMDVSGSPEPSRR